MIGIPSPSGNNPVTIRQGTPLSDAFGRVRVSDPHTIFDSKHLHDKNPLLWDAVISGAGASSTHSTTDADITMVVTDDGEYVIRQTKRKFNYQSGKSQEILETGVIGDTTGTINRIGFFDGAVTGTFLPKNGIFLQSADNVASLNIIKNGDTENQEIALQSNWNLDRMDGTGPSGITIDFTKTQILLIDFEWLGVGTVAIGFVINKMIYYVHNFHHANLFETVYMSSPNLPVRYEIRSTGGSGQLKQLCCSVVSEGGLQPTGISYSIDRGISALNVDTNDDYYVGMAVRLKSTHLDSSIDITRITAITATNADMHWILLLNPTVSSPLTFGDLANSAIQYSVQDGFTVTGGHVIDSGYYTQESNQVNVSVTSAIKLGSTIAGVSDVVVLAFQRIINQNEDVLCAINIFEQI